jgi:hypothetical protein
MIYFKKYELVSSLKKCQIKEFSFVQAHIFDFFNMCSITKHCLCTSTHSVRQLIRAVSSDQ